MSPDRKKRFLLDFYREKCECKTQSYIGCQVETYWSKLKNNSTQNNSQPLLAMPFEASLVQMGLKFNSSSNVSAAVHLCSSSFNPRSSQTSGLALLSKHRLTKNGYFFKSCSLKRLIALSLYFGFPLLCLKCLIVSLYGLV